MTIPPFTLCVVFSLFLDPQIWKLDTTYGTLGILLEFGQFYFSFYLLRRIALSPIILYLFSIPYIKSSCAFCTAVPSLDRIFQQIEIFPQTVHRSEVIDKQSSKNTADKQINRHKDIQTGRHAKNIKSVQKKWKRGKKKGGKLH